MYSDHKPLSYLFDSTQTVPQLASAHLQRWALTRSAYSYSIEYKAGNSNGNVDPLSRLPLTDIQTEISMTADCSGFLFIMCSHCYYVRKCMYNLSNNSACLVVIFYSFCHLYLPCTLMLIGFNLIIIQHE